MLDEAIARDIWWNIMVWKHENLPRISLDRPAKWLLLPGLIFQWVLYMFPAKGKAAESARQARSQLMTFYYSAIFYFVVLLVVGMALSK